MPYEYVSKRVKTAGVWGDFSTPTLWAHYAKDGDKGDKGDKGDAGDSGENADYYEMRYAVSGSPTAAPALTDNTARTPAGWTTTQPTLTIGQYLYFIIAKISGSDSTKLVDNWSVPVRLNGSDGADGHFGATPTFVGTYDSGKTYYGNSVRVDIVKYNNVYYIARYDAQDANSEGKFSGIVPTNTADWNQFGASFSNIATGFLATEAGVIQDLLVSMLQTSASGKRVEISKEDNNITIYDASGTPSISMNGDVNAMTDLYLSDSQNYTPTPKTAQLSGGSAQSNTEVSSTQTNLSFSLSKSGMVSGTVAFGVAYTENYTPGSGMSAIGGARGEVYLDGHLLASKASGSTGTVSFSLFLAVGTHTITTKLTLSVPNVATGTVAATLSGETFGTMHYRSSGRVSQYFANGHGVGSANDQFVIVLTDTNDVLHLKAISGTAGIDLYDNALKILLGGQWYSCSANSISGTLYLKLTATTN
jgi:hypothetical protein